MDYTCVVICWFRRGECKAAIARSLEEAVTIAEDLKTDKGYVNIGLWNDNERVKDIKFNQKTKRTEENK